MGIVIQAGCDTSGLANDFTAESYFGYNACIGADVIQSDLNVLFQDLSGENGLAQRTTTGASGYGSTFIPAPSNVPVTLSPAVTNVSPSAGSGIGGGSASANVTQPGSSLERRDRLLKSDGGSESNTTTPVEVDFDTQMDTSMDPDKAVKVSGCGAEVTPGSGDWSDDGTQLTFDVSTPADATGNLTLTVQKNKAISEATTEGKNDNLDGNQNPLNTSGQAPNDTDYIWTLSCSNICIAASGIGSSCGTANSPPGVACVDTTCPVGAISVTVTEPGETAPFTISACCSQNGGDTISPASAVGPSAAFTIMNPPDGPNPCGVVFNFADTRANLNLSAVVSIQYCS